MKKIRRLPLPETSDSFLMRICKALDEPPRMLAYNLGVDYSELEPLLDDRHKLAEMDKDYVWWELSRYVDERLGVLMAIRFEMTKALEKDRSRRAVRAVRQKNIMQKESPRVRHR